MANYEQPTAGGQDAAKREDVPPPPCRKEIHWPHAPKHQLSKTGTYFVTAGTYLKEHHFRSKERLSVLHRGLLKVARDCGWELEAWAVFSNHYHFVGHSPESGPGNLPDMLNFLHGQTADWINRLDGQPGRKVWHNYWDTRLTYQKSYLARLNYVHQNPVRHCLVRVGNLYPWCSAAWFERTASPAQINVIYSLPTDRVNVYDKYEADDAW